MIVLDTDVISALMRRPYDKTAARWLNHQPEDEIWTTAVTVYEVRFGIERLAAASRQRQLESAFEQVLNEDVGGRVLPFDAAAARSAAALGARREKAGRLGDDRDTWIAGIVISRQAMLATRNVRHFADLDMGVIDPWAENDSAAR